MDSKEQIIKAATKLFATNGYVATSIRAITKECNINLSMISYYFGGKEGLYVAVLESQMQVIVEIISQAQEKPSAKESLESYAQNLIKALKKNPNFANLLIMEFSNPTQLGTQTIGAFFSKGQEFILNHLGRGVERGEFREDIELFHIAFCFVGILNFYLMSKKYLKHANHRLDEDYIKNALEIFFKGIEKVVSD